MADLVRLPHSDPEEPLREAVAYLYSELGTDERAAFEAHLPTCERCQKAVLLGRKLFPAVDRLLAEAMPVRAPKDYLALLAAAEAKVDAEERARVAARAWPSRRRFAPRRPWLVAGAALAVAAAALLLFNSFAPLLEPAPVPTREREFAPRRPGGDPIPPPAELAVSAELHGQALALTAARQPGDLHAAVLLVDSKRRVWRVQPPASPALACAGPCGAIRLRIDLAPLPQGPVTAVVVAGPEPLDEPYFDYALRAPWPPHVGERAAGRVEIPR